MGEFDVICVGDSIIDAFLQIHGANEKCRLSESSELCIRYGDKITVDKCDFLLGGNACNVAVGVSRMGFKSSLIAEIGDDEFSQKIINGLSKEKVDTSNLLQTKGAASSFAIGLNFKGERTLFVEHVQREHNFSFERIASKWVYLTSLGKDWEKAYRNTLDFVKTNNLHLAFNPGSVQLEELNEVIWEVLGATDILFVNKEEASRIAHQRGPVKSVPPTSAPSSLASSNEVRAVGSPSSFATPDTNVNSVSLITDSPRLNNVAQLLFQLHAIGPKNVVITDGRNGSYLIDESSKTFFLDMFPGEPVERTGAGDAYTSGFLSAMLSGLPASEAMKWGTINGASVVLQVGAQAGLLSKKEVEEKLIEHPEFEAKELL